MVSLRLEAQDPSTTALRLVELTQLPGDRGHADADAGWCREHVAANPSAPPALLAELATDIDDCVVRANVANNPATERVVLERLAEDRLDWVANAARARLGWAPRTTSRIPGPAGRYSPKPI